MPIVPFPKLPATPGIFRRSAKSSGIRIKSKPASSDISKTPVLVYTFTEGEGTRVSKE
jgi:hypothetical protein